MISSSESRSLLCVKRRKMEIRSLIKYLSALLLFGLNGIVASFIPLNSYEIVFLKTFIGSVFLAVLFLAG